jgi:nitrogen fixation NifU-like protein
VLNQTILDHFQNPRNAGELPEPALSVEVTNPVCGDILCLWILADVETIRQIRFKARGCVSSIACGSALTELVQGKSLAEAKGLNSGDIAKALNGLPPEGGHASALAIDALTAVIKIVREDQAFSY